MTTRNNMFTRLVLGITAMLMIFALVFLLLLQHTCRQLIVEHFEKITLELVVKNTQLVDGFLSSVVSSTKALNVDEDFYHLVKDADEGATDKLITQYSKLEYRYFSDYDHIVSINITSPYFESAYKYVYYPYDQFISSDLYDVMLTKPPYDRWIATTNIADDAGFLINLGHIKDVYRNQKVFSYIRYMNCSTVIDDNVLMVNPSVSKPFCIINFDPALYSEYFQSTLLTDNSCYVITTPDGRMIYGETSQKNQQSTAFGADDFTWLDASGSAQNRQGSTSIILDGKSYIVCFCTSNVNDWVSAALIPMDDLIGIMHTALEKPVIITALVYALLVLIVILYSKRTSKPVRLLAEAASSGDFTELKKLKTPNEIVRITDSLKSLNERLDCITRTNRDIARREQLATIRFLESQLNPHFLRNTLGRINIMAINAGQLEISDRIYELSEMLQYSLDVKTHFVYLYQDIEQLKRYIAIAKGQMEGRLSLYCEIDPLIYNCIVPKHLLQPFVENSIIHGFKNMQGSCVIRVRTNLIDSHTLELFVEDNGQGIAAEQTHHLFSDSVNGHIGCSNADQRIKLLYGDEYGVDFIEGTYTTFRIRLPYMTDIPDDDGSKRH